MIADPTWTWWTEWTDWTEAAGDRKATDGVDGLNGGSRRSQSDGRSGRGRSGRTGRRQQAIAKFSAQLSLPGTLLPAVPSASSPPRRNRWQGTLSRGW